MDGKWSPSRGNFAANADRSRPHQICGRRLSTLMRFQPSGLARSIGKNQTPVHHRLRNIRKARSRELQDPSKWYARHGQMRRVPFGDLFKPADVHRLDELRAARRKAARCRYNHPQS